MSLYKTLLVPIIEKVLIKEIGEANIPPLKWTQVSPYRYKFLIDIDDYTEVVTVEFQQLIDTIEKQFYLSNKYADLNNVFNIGFDVSGNENQFKKSTMKNLLQILSTIVDIIKHFISNNLFVDGFYIRATPKSIDSKNNTQKTDLYKAFIKKNLSNLKNFSSGWHRDGLILIKIK
jgi:hypothetical protein